MGAHSSTLKPDVSSVFPKFFYLERSSGYLITFESPKAKTTKLSADVPLLFDSAICEFEGVFFLIGGYRDPEQFESTFISLDASTLKLKHLERIPVPSKLGYIIPYKRSLLYVGGVSVDPITQKKIQSPIMKYNLLNDTWEIYNHSNAVISRTNNICFKDVRKPGFLLVKTSLIMFGGYYRTSNLRESNKKVLCFDITTENFDFFIESYHFPTEIYSPIVASCKTRGIVAGGKTLNSTLITSVYEFSKSQFFKVKNINLLIPENYPPVCQPTFDIIFAYPTLNFKQKHSKEWQRLSLESELPKGLKIIKSASLKLMKNIRTNQTESKFSPNSSGSTARMFTFASQSIKSDAFSNRSEEMEKIDLEIVLQTEHDQEVKILHKAALKLVVFVADKLEKKKMGPLEVNQISAQLNFLPEISLIELLGLLDCVLQKTKYSVNSLLVVYKALHRILLCEQVKSLVLVKILKMVGVGSFNERVSKDLAIFILGRMVKAGIIGV